MSFVQDQLEPGEIITYQARSGIFSYIGGALYLLAFLMPSKILRAARTEIAVTNKRVIAQTGAYRKKRIILDHKDIQTVKIRRGLFGSSNIVISGKNGDRLVFQGIPYPEEVQQVIQEANEMAVLGRKLSQIDLSS